MRNPLKRVKELIAVLPEKDSKLVKEYIDKRDFDSALEIVESDIYKAENNENYIKYGIPDDYMLALSELKSELLEYLSYIEIPKDDNNYY